jgi:hypothetical protein
MSMISYEKIVKILFSYIIGLIYIVVNPKVRLSEICLLLVMDVQVSRR